MLLFAHTGITLGVGVLSAGLISRKRLTKDRKLGVSSPPQQSFHSIANTGRYGISKMSWLESLASYADIRLLLVGSLLPDIIDKPVGLFLFRTALGNGRIFSHNLLFLVIISLIGFYLYQGHHQTWLLVLSFGTFAHLILDEMWRTPGTLLWPVYGFAFEKTASAPFVPSMLYALLNDPQVYITELVGMAVLIWLFQSLVRRRKVLVFLRYGRVQ